MNRNFTGKPGPGTAGASFLFFLKFGKFRKRCATLSKNFAAREEVPPAEEWSGL